MQSFAADYPSFSDLPISRRTLHNIITQHFLFCKSFFDIFLFFSQIFFRDPDDREIYSPSVYHRNCYRYNYLYYPDIWYRYKPARALKREKHHVDNRSQYMKIEFEILSRIYRPYHIYLKITDKRCDSRSDRTPFRDQQKI